MMIMIMMYVMYVPRDQGDIVLFVSSGTLQHDDALAQRLRYFSDALVY